MEKPLCQKMKTNGRVSSSFPSNHASLLSSVFFLLHQSPLLHRVLFIVNIAPPERNESNNTRQTMFALHLQAGFNNMIEEFERNICDFVYVTDGHEQT
jgi:hypothetical protein